MSVETVTTYTTTKRSCRTKGKTRKRSSRVDLTCQPELKELKAPEVHIEDDLGLDLLQVCDIPKDMLFPGEYNVYLQDRLKGVCEENKLLSALLKEHEEELAKTKEKLKQLEMQQNGQGLCQTADIPGSIRHADLAACRVIELSKQVCELTVQLEEQKSRCVLAENKLLSLVNCAEEKQPLSAEILTKKEAEIKALSEKLHVTNTKLFECRNKTQQLQQELKIAQKVLTCEVGDGVSISDLISSGGSAGHWRGRAQQIKILQQRITELSDRLKKCCDYRTLDCPQSNCGETKCSLRDRKASLETAQQETRLLQQQLNENLRKLDAAKARVKVLESEIGSCKARIQLLTEKSVRDDDFIHVLQGQISHLEGCLQVCKDDSRTELKKSEKHYQLFVDDLRMEKQRNMHLLSKLEDKEKQIKRLEEMLFELKDKELLALKRDINSEITVALDLPSTSASARMDVDNNENQVKENRNTILAEIECKKLLEVVGTTNRRLNDARHECDKHKSALRLERHRLARVEAKLARLETERSTPFSLARRNAIRKGAVVPSDEMETITKEELQDKLELLQEEILTLKTRLSCLEQEKEDDLRAFSSMLSGSSQQILLKRNQNCVTLPAIEPS